MNMTNFFRKSNSLQNLKISELQEEELRLKSRINRLRKDIDTIEKEKKRLFSEGIGADLIKKKIIAQELRQLDTSGKFKFKNFLVLHKQYMFVSNLVTIKKYQRDLQTTPIWDKIQKMSPKELELALIKVQLSGKGVENVIDDLNGLISMDFNESDSEVSETEKQMFSIWNSVEGGSLDITEAENIISMDKEIKRSLEDSEY